MSYVGDILIVSDGELMSLRGMKSNGTPNCFALSLSYKERVQYGYNQNKEQTRNLI